MRPLALLCVALLLSANASAEFPEYAHPVMTWVPPYGIAKVQLNGPRGVPGVEEALTHLALQFWAPTRTGEVERVKQFGELGDATIAEFRTWAHAHGIRVMLCVYNGVEKWDWPLARAAFAEHGEKFATALIEQALKLGLDGIDIDLEGNGSFDRDKKAFVSFIDRLVKLAHAAHLHVTVCSFSYKWNAPNQTWWNELLPLVDALTTMGYEETGAQSESWRAFSAQKAAAGAHAGKLMMGLPTNKGEWQGARAVNHLEWLRDHGVGAAMWDAQFESAAWRKGDVWAVLRRVRQTQ